jgi:transposase-like protein
LGEDHRGHRFPASIIQHAIWLYFRFTLTCRDVEELLAERGLDLSYETVRRWVLKFGPLLARRLRQRRPLYEKLGAREEVLHFDILVDPADGHPEQETSSSFPQRPILSGL